MKKIFLLLLIGAGLGFCQAVDSLDYWPLQVGNQWIYQDSSGVLTKDEILHHSHAFYNLFAWPSFLLKNDCWNIKNDSTRVLAVRGDGVHIGYASWCCQYSGGFFVSRSLIFSFAVQNDSFQTSPTNSDNQLIRVLSHDSTIIVPAGTFNHCLVYSTGAVYAPHVGPIKSCVNGFNPHSGLVKSLVYAKANGVEYGIMPIASAVEMKKETFPQSFNLQQNYPNPFNPGTLISFDLPTADYIDLSVYDLIGRKLRGLISGYRPTGCHRTTWDGRDDQNHALPSGTYLIRLQVGNNSKTIKAVLTK